MHSKCLAVTVVIIIFDINIITISTSIRSTNLHHVVDIVHKSYTFKSASTIRRHNLNQNLKPHSKIHIFKRNLIKLVKFDITNETELDRVFLNIISLGSKDNTYKFAMARFLLDYSREHDIKDTHVDFSVIAEYFLRYYWPQICKLKMKHAPQKKKKPVIIQIIEKEFKKPYYPQTYKEITKNEPTKIERCKTRIVNECFHNVIWRFQKIKVNKSIESRIFYDYKISKYVNSNRKYIDLNYGININADAMIFLKKYNAILLKSVILEWAKFLENLNVGLPKLILKTEGMVMKRTNLKKFRNVLERICKKCFYCHMPLDNIKDIQVEHVIPFDYIAEDDIWNLVLVCQRCNCKKLGALPPSKYITRLVERNDRHCTTVQELQNSLSRLNTEFETVVSKHYENARLQGYMVLDDDFYK